MVNFAALLWRRTVSSVVTQTTAYLAPLVRQKGKTASKSTARQYHRRVTTKSHNSLAQPRRQYHSNQQFKQELKREQQQYAAQIPQQGKPAFSLPSLFTSTRFTTVPKQYQSVTQPLVRKSYRTFSTGANKGGDLGVKNAENALQIKPESTATLPATPASVEKSPSLFNRLDDKLISVGNVASAKIKRRVPRGKVILYSILILGTYFFLQNRIMRNSTRWVNENVINMKRKQITSLKEIASLSVEDIFHVFQTIYPDLTSNGMLPVDRISYAIYDEIDDCRDDRKLAENKLRNLVTIFVHNSHAHFAKVDKIAYEAELQVLFKEIQQNLPPKTEIEFDPQTFELNLKLLEETKVENNDQNGQNGQNVEIKLDQNGQPIPFDDTTTPPSTPITHPLHPQHSGHPNPAVELALNDALGHTNLIKQQIHDKMNDLVTQQQSLFGRLDLTADQRQVEVGKIQHELTHMQQQLSLVEDQQHEIRNYVFNQFDQQQSPQNNHNSELFASLMEQYGQIFTKRKEVVETLNTNQKSQDKLIAELSPEEQESTLKFLKKRQFAEQQATQTAQLDHKFTHIHNAKDKFILTPLDLDPTTMPTLEDAYSYNYFHQDNDEYKISTWTMLALFRNLPTGTAADERYVKFGDAIVATAALAKTQWSPADPHYQYYVKPDILRYYRLNVQRAFRDYLDDPLCQGGIVSVGQYLDADNLQRVAREHGGKQIDQKSVENTPNGEKSDLINGKILSPIDEVSQVVSNFFTIPKAISNIWTSEVQHAKAAEEKLVDEHYTKVHFDRAVAKLLSNDGQISPHLLNTIPAQIKFESIYHSPLDDRIAILGEIFSRHHPDCKWESIPIEVRTLLANRFEHLRLRKISNFAKNYDYNPSEPLRLAWTSMFPPDSLADTPQAKNQYRRSLGNYDEQVKRVDKTLDLIQQQTLSRPDFEKLISMMCNAGHFKSRSALLTRTNRIWPIAYHTTSPQVIAQAYYDVLDKEVDESISLEEFHKAAAHWGKVGRYNLWYYAPELQGQGDKITGSEKMKLKWGERIARLCYNWTGVPDWLSKYISNTPNGKLNLHYLDLQERFIQTKLNDAKKEYVTGVHQNHAKNGMTLAQFSSHSRNVNSALVGDGNSTGNQGKKDGKRDGKKEREKGSGNQGDNQTDQAKTNQADQNNKNNMDSHDATATPLATTTTTTAETIIADQTNTQPQSTTHETTTPDDIPPPETTPTTPTEGKRNVTRKKNKEPKELKGDKVDKVEVEIAPTSDV